jgi:transporter family protein
MYAFGSALAASATAILAKIGISGVPSNLATALRTTVVLLFAWAIVFATRDHLALRELKPRSVVFLVLSRVARRPDRQAQLGVHDWAGGARARREHLVARRAGRGVDGRGRTAHPRRLTCATVG